MPHTGLLTFCIDPARDRVGPLAFHIAQRLLPLESTGIQIDCHEVLSFTTPAGDRLFLVGIDKVMPHDYPHYVPQFKQHFPDAECAIVMNWHEGVDAPDKVITFHTNGNVASAHWATVSPVHVRNVLLWAEQCRKELSLVDYRVLTEATHWSGFIDNQDPSQIETWDVAVYDFEIGSSPEAWTNPAAAEVLIRAAVHVFDKQQPFTTLLCVGGMHFQEDYVSAVLANHPDVPLSLGHIIHTKWMESSDYLDQTGKQRFEHCISRIQGGIQGIVFHDNLRGPHKAILRTIAQERNIPVFHHKRLRNLTPDLLVRQ